jgi:SAM-dependent methyltransferase
VLYRIDFACDDRDPLQQRLNQLYDYRDDVPTKVLHRCRLNLFTLIVRRLIERGAIGARGSALDVGCNSGMYSRILSDFGFENVLGVDIVEEMIRKANAAFGSEVPGHAVRFEIRDAERLDLARRFDLVLCTEVIEHVDHPDRVIANLKTVLAPGGVLIVSLPNRDSLPYLIARAIRRLRRKPRDQDFERHVSYPFHRSMRLLEGEGLERVATDGTNLIWDDHSLRLFYGTPLFPAINRATFELARLAPFRYASQFFYVVMRRRS